MDSSDDWKRESARWWGRVLTGGKAHWCPDWDYLPIDDTCVEMQVCTCVFERTEDD